MFILHSECLSKKPKLKFKEIHKSTQKGKYPKLMQPN